MKNEPDIAAVAALLGDPARANILSALLDGRALTVTELAAAAGIGLPTASIHVSKLEQAGLLASLRQGRNRYVRLSGEDVAHTLESLMLLAARTGHKRVRTGPRDPALREARVCYDHLAGARGVQMLQSMLMRGYLERGEDSLALTRQGERFTADLGIDAAAIAVSGRALCLSCLDWSERRDHLAGKLGAAYLARFLELKWASRDRSSRAVLFSRRGLAEFDRTFPV